MQTEKAKSSHFDRTRGLKNQIFPTIIYSQNSHYDFTRNFEIQPKSILFTILKFTLRFQEVFFKLNSKSNCFLSSKFTLVPSMWFWSVSWLTNCPVYLSFFLVDQKKLSSLRSFLFTLLNFLSSLFQKMRN